MPRPKSPKNADRGHPAARDEFLLAAEHGAAAHGLTLVAELGHRAAGPVAYLAREEASGALAIAVVTPTADSTGSFDFAITRELDVSIPGPASSCQICGRAVEGWTRFCQCGNDLSGVAPADDGERGSLLERVHQATAGEFEVFGAIPYSAGGGSAYFGKSRDTGAILALWLRHDGHFDDDSHRLAVIASEPLPAPASATDSPFSGPLHFTLGESPLARSSMGSGLLAKQPTPKTQQAVAVPKVCPQCGGEYETGSRFCPNDGSPLRPKGGSDPLVGRVIAERYIVLKRLGEGGMGRVYLGEHVKMNRQCAIKVMSAALVNDTDSAKRFAREASSAARIIHPNVAAVFDYGESEGLVYIVMEYVDGEPLSHVVEREHVLAPHRALDIARQVLDGLAAAHELGIVHRDLKPDNIIITRARSGREVAKVVDFGIAKAMQGEGDEALTRTGLVIGTPEYMSPEQLLGDPVDARSDVYSLGCILFQMLTGSPSFHAQTREQMIKRRLTEEPPYPRAVNPEVPVALDVVVHRMLARAPEDRYASAAEVRDLLTPELALESTANPLHRLTPRSAPTLMLEAYGLASGQMAARARRSRRWLVIGGGVAGALAIAAITAAVTLRRQAGPPAATHQIAPSDTAPGRQVAVAASRVGAGAPMGVTTAARATREAAKGATGRHADSSTPARKDAPATPAPKLSPDERATHAVVEAYRSAIEAADTAKLRVVYPKIPESQQNRIQKTVFDLGRDIHATVTYTTTAITGRKADVDFVMELLFNYGNGGQRGSTKLKYHALMAKEGGKWQLKEIRFE